MSRCRRILVEPNEPRGDAAIANASELIAQLRGAGVTLPLLVDAQNDAAWPVLSYGIGRGYDIRIGLEDSLFLPDGQTARDNAALVRAARALIGRESPELRVPCS